MLFIISVLFAVGCLFLLLSDLFGDDWSDKVDSFLTDTAKVIFVGVPVFVAYMATYLLIPSLVICSLIIGLEFASPHITQFFGG